MPRNEAEEALKSVMAADPGLPVRILRDLIRIPSVNPWFGDSPYAGEKAAQEWLARWLAEMGAEVSLEEPDAEALSAYASWPGYYANRSFCGRPNLWARFSGCGEGRSLLLVGHIDVVAPGDGWSHQPFAADETEGRIVGRGAVDMKGGLAAMLAALAYLRRAGVDPLGDVLFATAVDEEAGGMGTLALVVGGLRADGAILGEPTAMKIAPLCRGILWGRIIVYGRSGHIELSQPHWRDGGAVDAIAKARTVLSWIDELNAEWAGCKTHPLLPEPCAIKIAQINAGHSPTSYADRAEIIFDAQYLPGERDPAGLGRKVKNEIETWLRTCAGRDEWLSSHPPELTWLVDADCAETPEDHPLVGTVAEALAETRGGQVCLEGAGCHTDMGLLSRVGIPTLNFGPGNPRVAHQVDESLEIGDLQAAAGVYARTILKWCGWQLRKQGERDA